MEPTGTIETRAYAKVNLALAVAPPHPEGHADAGLHPVCSWMHAVDLHDTVRVIPTDPDDPSSFEIKWADGGDVSWPIEHDLAFRAHDAMEQASGRHLPVRIEVIKSIPAGGGLGGGSADAAAVFMTLDRMFMLAFGGDKLTDLSRRLGSDIAFLIDPEVEPDNPPRPAIVEGLGDVVTRLAPVRADITLILPEFWCRTGAIFAAFDKSDRSGGFDPARVRQLASAQPIASGARIASGDTIDSAGLFNDLADPACAVQPELGELRSALRESLQQPVHVTGSGSTLFILGHADEAVIGRVAPGCRVVHTRLI
ncbi:MAG: 4-diphosphocytidyl-2-C-methyl-D-erythritol kinase [Phycisphaerales bacterium]